MTKEGAIGLLRRTFLRAYTREQWGMEKSLSQSKLAAYLTDLGCKTSVTDVKNASRSSEGPALHSVPRTVLTESVIGLLKEKFPGMEEQNFFPVDSDVEDNAVISV